MRSREDGLSGSCAFNARRQDSQWQHPIAAGSPVTVNCTAPQKQLPLLDFKLLMATSRR